MYLYVYIFLLDIYLIKSFIIIYSAEHKNIMPTKNVCNVCVIIIKNLHPIKYYNLGHGAPIRTRLDTAWQCVWENIHIYRHVFNIIFSFYQDFRDNDTDIARCFLLFLALYTLLSILFFFFNRLLWWKKCNQRANQQNKLLYYIISGTRTSHNYYTFRIRKLISSRYENWLEQTNYIRYVDNTLLTYTIYERVERDQYQYQIESNEN